MGPIRIDFRPIAAGILIVGAVGGALVGALVGFIARHLHIGWQ